jgi:dihydroxy-acid dehydratase
MCIGYVSPEAAAGGPLALIRNGDVIRIDARKRSMDVELSAEELAKRRAAWTPPAKKRIAGTLEKYATLVGPANLGAVTHSGGVVWEAEE